MSLSHETLIRFRDGEAAAFAEVVRMYASRVRAIASRYLRSPFHQEEAMQEAWIQVHRRRDSFDPERLDDFEGWLFTLARRRCIDYARRVGRGEARELAGDTTANDEAPPPSDPVEQRDLRAAVAEFEERLDPQWREFFALHFVQGLDYAEVGERLGISRIRCKYMKKVIARRAQRHRPLLEALGRYRRGMDDAPPE